MFPCPARPRRLACTAIFLLLWLVFGSLPASGAEEPDAVLARVNDHEIRRSDVDRSIESLALGEQIEPRSRADAYAEALIREEVLFQYALARELGEDRELRDRVREIVVNRLIETRVRSRLKVSDAEARAFYEANPSQVRGEHVRVREILLRERPQCEQMMAGIDSEETFAQMARRHSLDVESAAGGGDSGLMMRPEAGRAGSMDGARSHELAYFDMTPGEMRVFDVVGGCLLVWQVSHDNPPLPPFDAVRGQIRDYLLHVQEVRLFEALFAEAARHVTVERVTPSP